MNELQTFTSAAFGSVRIIDKGGQPWFVGKDVADILGYSNSSKAIPQHVDEEDRQKQNLPTAQNGKLVAAAKPKVLFADAVSASDSTILIGDLAKILKQNGHPIGQKRLFCWMREQGYLIKRAGADYNSPTQRAMEMGLFKIKETAISHSDGHVSVSKTTKVTGKGQQYFINKFCGA